jgi:nitrite reductase/ring-hydroxylating ferredoxin subunit
MSDSIVKVGTIGDFPEGKLKKVQVAGEDVLMVKVEGKIYAIAGSAPTWGHRLARGSFREPLLSAPGMEVNLMSRPEWLSVLLQ